MPMPNSHTTHNDNIEFVNKKSCKVAKYCASYAIKQIRVMKKPSSTKYLDAFKESSERSSELLQIDSISGVLTKH